MKHRLDRPIHRSPLRLKLGGLYHTALRRLLWLRMRDRFARERSEESLPFTVASHETPLIRRLKDVDMWMQHNKIQNLRLAAACLDGTVVRPGEVFSYWYLIGNPTRRRGYVEGMVLRGGKVVPGVGGGLCQLSNLIFWMTLHTPLTVIERHRHGYDVFPDAGRTQPFGSGATCFYPYGDLMIRNDTDAVWQLRVSLTKKTLVGEWRCDREYAERWEVVERGHEMRAEFYGGYTRHNELYRRTLAADGTLLGEELVVKNDAVMMYTPYLEEGTPEDTKK